LTARIVKVAFGSNSKTLNVSILDPLSDVSRPKCRFGLPVERYHRAVIQTPYLGDRIMRYELSDEEWTTIKPMLPNKPRGVPRVNDRRVLNGIF